MLGGSVLAVRVTFGDDVFLCAEWMVALGRDGWSLLVEEEGAGTGFGISYCSEEHGGNAFLQYVASGCTKGTI